jgi:hypothetical protein
MKLVLLFMSVVTPAIVAYAACNYPSINCVGYSCSSGVKDPASLQVAYTCHMDGAGNCCYCRKRMYACTGGGNTIEIDTDRVFAYSCSWFGSNKRCADQYDIPLEWPEV